MINQAEATYGQRAEQKGKPTSHAYGYPEAYGGIQQSSSPY